MRNGFLLTVILGLAAAGAIVYLNLQPRHYAGDYDYKNPWAEIWSGDPRIEYGWPVEWIRVFDEPSPLNASGRFTESGLILDGMIWVWFGMVCCLPMVVAFFIRRRRAARAARESGKVLAS
jgi:hypothetical protein